MDAFILAAGRGERLRPLTDSTPKPLLEVGGRALIDHHLERLAAAGFARAVINVSWLGERIMEAVGDGARFGIELAFSREPEGALETAGGIVHALDLIRSDVFAVVNGDVWTDFPLGALRSREGFDAGLVMVSNPPHHPGGDFALVEGRLEAAGRNRPSLTYAGIGWFRRAPFEALAPGRRALRPLLDDLVRRGRLAGCRHHGRWIDIGTAARLEEADRLARNTPGRHLP